MAVLLLTPPMTQLNTPYPAAPVLYGFLRDRGVDVYQADLSLEVALKMFTCDILKTVLNKIESDVEKYKSVKFFKDNSEAYIKTIEPVVSFLQGKNAELAWRIKSRNFLPEGPRFDVLYPFGDTEKSADFVQEMFGILPVNDEAKLMASLYLDDVADVLKATIAPDFELSKYAERIGTSAETFDSICERLKSPELTVVDKILQDSVILLLDNCKPDIVGITIPFPGTVYGAFRTASFVRELLPSAKIVMGGGYINSELRDLSDERVFEYVDYICYDEGFEPWLSIIEMSELKNVRTSDGVCFSQKKQEKGTKYIVRETDYTGLDLSRYLNVFESLNPMHRLWTDGRWLKVQLTGGCYWHRCAFCDVGLDYIGRYQSPDAVQAVDVIVKMQKATNISGFHFTDEALPPSVIKAVAKEIIKRDLSISWWGNIRFDLSFDEELISLMAESGCIAVSGGLECANDRLLNLMNKGITLAGTKKICKLLSGYGIMVHVYLMYGFPTETFKETVKALEYVRNLFRDGYITSGYWHRFALTVHSPIAKHADKFGITIDEIPNLERRFALNEIPYKEPDVPDLDMIGEGLRYAMYNYMLGLGFEQPAREWFNN